MDSPRVIDVGELVERSPLGRFQVRVFVLIAACLALDGFDLQAMGYVAPAILREWGVAKADLGPVFSAGLFGLFAGSLASGVLADRIGRRPVLLGATAWFSAFTLATAAASSVPQLVVVRFLAGLGLGAMMPNATALVGEYSPARRRVGTMMVVTNGFMVGAVVAGFVSAWLIPTYGWRSVFLVGGAAPLAILIPMTAILPESLQLLVARGARQERIARWAARLAGAPHDGAALYVAKVPPRGGNPLLALFREGRAPATALLWTAGFMNVLVAFFVASWLPAVLGEAGFSTRVAVLVGTAVQVGGTLGTFALGFAAQRLGIHALLAACFVGAAAMLPLVAHPGLPLTAIFVTAFLLGWGVFGGQPGLNALAATCYPTQSRSTGIGAALAVGRFGAFVGPLVASELMRRQWSNEGLFRAAALPALVAVAAVLALRRLGARSAAPGRATPTSRPSAPMEGAS